MEIGIYRYVPTVDGLVAEVRSAAEDLRDALGAEMRVGESAMNRARYLQIRSTQVLVLLGLAATLVVLGPVRRRCARRRTLRRMGGHLR